MIVFLTANSNYTEPPFFLVIFPVAKVGFQSWLCNSAVSIIYVPVIVTVDDLAELTAGLTDFHIAQDAVSQPITVLILFLPGSLFGPLFGQRKPTK